MPSRDHVRRRHHGNFHLDYLTGRYRLRSLERIAIGGLQPSGADERRPAIGRHVAYLHNYVYVVSAFNRDFDQRLGRSTYLEIGLLRRAGVGDGREIVGVLIERQADSEGCWIPQTREGTDR